MAMDNFIGWSLPDKVAMLLSLQQARLTGRVKEANSAMRVGTAFEIKETNITQLLRELEYSISQEPEPDASAPVHSTWAACAANVRPAVTLQSHY